MRNFIDNTVPTADILAHEALAAISKRFSLSVRGAAWGLFFWLPFTRHSVWLEWGTRNDGFGFERSTERDVEFYLGTVRGVVSLEPNSGEAHTKEVTL